MSADHKAPTFHFDGARASAPAGNGDNSRPLAFPDGRAIMPSTLHSERLPPGAELAVQVAKVPRAEESIVTIGHIRWLRDFVRDSAKGGWDHAAFLITLGTTALAILIITAIVANFDTATISALWAIVVGQSLYIFYKSIYDKHQLDIAVLAKTRRVDESLKMASIVGLFGSMACAIFAVSAAGSDNKLLLVSSTYAGFEAVYFLFKLRRVPLEIDVELSARFPASDDPRNDATPITLEEFKSALDFSINSSGGDWYHTAVIVFFALGSVVILAVTTARGNFEDTSHRVTYIILVFVCLLAFYMALLNKHNGEIKKFTTKTPFDRDQKALIIVGIIAFIGAIVYAVFVQAANDRLLAASAAYQCLQSTYYSFKLIRIPKDLRVEVRGYFKELQPLL
ncbi:Hypothetical protein POVN_LOCUS541 [uncultured virus]|nr:Hypothetical protein POVN_LOCUS541 [uncultured virus]